MFLRKSTGNDFHRLHEFIVTKTKKQLELAINNYQSEMNKAQNRSNEKKKVFLDSEESFKKRVWKLNKIYTRGREGKPQD